MINRDKLLDDRVNKRLLDIAEHINTQCMVYLNQEMIITSAYREDDPKFHGKGKAFDFTIEGLHVIEYAGYVWETIKTLHRENEQGFRVGLYEGIDPKDGKWKTHIHICIDDDIDYIVVYTGKYT